MNKAGKFLSATMALALGLSAVSYGTAQTGAAVAESEAQLYAESADEMGGYLYVHFIDEQETAAKEQLYFSISSNAKEWYILNNGASVAPITRSDPAGSDGGIRDPYILRKHDNSGYYIIATDLSIYNLANVDGHGGNCWGQSQQHGSHNIIVWETDDLTDLGKARMVEIAAPNATCTWAPEAIWDDEKNAYMVFWSVLANKSWDHDGTWETGMYWTHHVYRCYTTDFVTFTEPEIYIQSEQKTIDASIIKEGDTYYRFTKIETNTGDDIYNPNYGSKTIFMEKCKSLSGEWEMVSTYKIDGKHWSKAAGFEGPSIFKLNAKDSGGKEQWCLMLDDYGGAGYTPFMTDDISKGEFTKATDISIDSHGRHGSFLPLTKAEYNALCAKYNLQIEETPREHKEIFSMSFEDNTEVNTGSAAATPSGSFTYVDGVQEGTKAVQLDGEDHIKIEGSALAGLDGFTVSFAAKFNTPTGNNNAVRSWLFYAARNNDSIVWSASGTHEKYVGLIWGENGGQNLAAQRFWDGRTPSPSATVAANPTEWKHFTIVYGKKYTSIFVNGEQVARTASSIDLTTILESTPTIYIGRAQWGGGEYSNCVLDEYRIHNWGMTAAEVKDNYNKVMGITE